MNEIITVQVTFGNPGDIIPARNFDDAHWQQPDYANDWPEDDSQPELVGSGGKPLCLSEVFANNGTSYGWHDDPDAEPMKWDTLPADDSVVSMRYAKLKESWAGIQITGYLGKNGESCLELDMVDLFGENGELVPYIEYIIASAKKRIPNKEQSLPIEKSVSLVLVCDVNYIELDTDYGTEYDGPFVGLLGILDFSRLPIIDAPVPAAAGRIAEKAANENATNCTCRQ